MAKKVVTGFGVDVKVREAQFGDTMTYGKMQLLSVICSPTLKNASGVKITNPVASAARAELGLQPSQKLNWEYKGWSPDMIKLAHQVIDRYAKGLPPRQKTGSF